MKFSEKLKNLRLEKKLTQDELAQGIFVSRTLITKYESGTIYPTLENIEKLAIFFNIKTNDLINVEDSIEMSLDQMRFNRILNYILTRLVIFFSLVTIMIYCLPIFRKTRYVYPIPPGQQIPSRKAFNYSVISYIFDSGNALGIISLIICFINIGLSISIILMKNNMTRSVIQIINYIIFVISLFMILFTLIFCGFGAYSLSY